MTGSTLPPFLNLLRRETGGMRSLLSGDAWGSILRPSLCTHIWLKSTRNRRIDPLPTRAPKSEVEVGVLKVSVLLQLSLFFHRGKKVNQLSLSSTGTEARKTGKAEFKIDRRKDPLDPFPLGKVPEVPNMVRSFLDFLNVQSFQSKCELGVRDLNLLSAIWILSFPNRYQTPYDG